MSGDAGISWQAPTTPDPGPAPTSATVTPTALVDPAESDRRPSRREPDPGGLLALWQVIPLALTLAAPFVVGALYGYAAIKRGDRTGWVGMLIHLAMTIVAIVLPISESIGK